MHNNSHGYQAEDEKVQMEMPHQPMPASMEVEDMPADPKPPVAEASV